MTEEVFPLVTYEPQNKKWKCLGTGFFINPTGAFVSAKHVFMDSDGKMEQTLYSVHNANDGSNYIRPVKQLVYHPKADILVGLVGEKRIEAESFKPEMSRYCILDLGVLENNDEIYTYAYPNTQSEDLNELEIEFTFTSRLSKGQIIDYHKEGSPVVRNRCYQTNMRVDSGASGGPVFKNGFIVGVNSSGFTLPDDEEPISFITPIDYILDLSVKEKDKIISIRELIQNGHVKIKQNPT